jgi:hypothetical protein
VTTSTSIHCDVLVSQQHFNHSSIYVGWRPEKEWGIRCNANGSWNTSVLISVLTSKNDSYFHFSCCVYKRMTNSSRHPTVRWLIIIPYDWLLYILSLLLNLWNHQINMTSYLRTGLAITTLTSPKRYLDVTLRTCYSKVQKDIHDPFPTLPYPTALSTCQLTQSFRRCTHLHATKILSKQIKQIGIPVAHHMFTNELT